MVEEQEPTVLLVEDDLNHQVLVDVALQRADPGVRLRSVPDGADAIRYLSGEKPFHDRRKFPLPAVIILDLKLSKVSGFEVLRWLQDQRALWEIPVLVFTTSDDPDDAKRAFSLGARAYRQKSEDFSVIADEVRDLLDRWVDEPGQE